MLWNIFRICGKGRRKISIVAFDSDNHVTHAERELVYNDYTSPVFSLDRPLRFSLNADDLTEGLSAEDCLDGTITDRIRISYEDEISSTPGLYHVTYSVANRAGDVTSLPVTVELYDPAEENGRPQITLSDYLIHLDLQQPFDPQAYLESVSVDQMLYEREKTVRFMQLRMKKSFWEKISFPLTIRSIPAVRVFMK